MIRTVMRGTGKLAREMLWCGSYALGLQTTDVCRGKFARQIRVLAKGLEVSTTERVSV